MFNSRHFHDNRTSIRFPDTIEVNEHRAPTDESIRLMEQMHDKAIKNIIAKVKVDDNLVNGEFFMIEQPWNMNEVKLWFKFKINGHEFNIEREVSRSEFELDEDSYQIRRKLYEIGKSYMVWYLLKKMMIEFYEKVVNEKIPEYLIK